MDGNATEPLTPGEAKDRLRAAARRISPATWVEHHPIEAVGVALAAGMVAGRLRPSPALLATLTERLVPVIAGRLISRTRKKKKHGH